MSACHWTSYKHRRGWPNCQLCVGGAGGMWVWEPPAKLAPSRSCPSHERVQKCSLSTLPWRWTQNPHRPVCSEGSCLGEGHAEALLQADWKVTHIAEHPSRLHVQACPSPPPSIPGRISAYSSWAATTVHTTSGWLSGLFPRCSLESCLLAKHLQPNQTTKASNGWVLYFLQGSV